MLEWNTFYNLSVHFPREVVKLGDRAMNLAYSLIYLSLDLCWTVVKQALTVGDVLLRLSLNDKLGRKVDKRILPLLHVKKFICAQKIKYDAEAGFTGEEVWKDKLLSSLK